MMGIGPDRGGRPGRDRRGAALAAVWLALILPATRGAGAAEVGRDWPLGRWRVVGRGWGFDCPIQSLEIRPEARAGGATVVAEAADGRSLGSGRLERPAAGPGRDRWLRAGWEAGPSAVLLQLRPDRGGGLTALVRERPIRRPEAAPQQVRQLALERVGPAGPPTRAADEPADPGAMPLFVVGVDGRGLRVVAPPEGFRRAAQPAWSRAGNWLAFAAFDATGRDPLIRVVRTAGGPTTALAAGTAPSWSRAGDRLAYVAGGRPEFATDWDAPGRNDERIEAIRLAGPDAGRPEVLVPAGLRPRWSPADDRLAYVARVEGNWDLYVRPADGGPPTRLTDDPALDTNPAWSADGTGLIFLSDRGNRWDLYRVGADGREPAVRLTDHPRREDGAEPSPDGQTIAFHDAPGRPRGGLLLLDLAGGSVRRLLDPPHGDRDPAWSPDGRFLAFAGQRPAPAPATATGSAPGAAGGVLGGQ